MKKKFLALVMTLSMVLSLVPVTALATGDSTTSVTQEGQSAGADANGSNQEGGSNADSDSTTTSGGGRTDTSKDSNTNPENKDENQNGEPGSTGGTTPGGPSKPDAGTTEEGENTPIAVPADKLIFDKTKGEITGIDATLLDENKDKLLSVTIPAEIDSTPVTTIGQNAFNAKNAGLTNHPQVAAVDFSDATNLEKIDSQAFMHSPVASVDLSKTKVATIGKFAFGECTSLETFIFPDTLTSLGNSDGASVFTDCKSLKVMRLANSPQGVVFALPENLTYIGKYTFKDCFADGVDAKVVIPTSVATLGEGAFYDKHITQIIINKKYDAWSGGSLYDSRAIRIPDGTNCMIIFPDKSTYESFTGYSSTEQNAMTYPVQVKFFINTWQSEYHLNDRLLGYQKNANTGFWEFDDSYALPEAPASSAEQKPGYDYISGWSGKDGANKAFTLQNDKPLHVTPRPDGTVRVTSGQGTYVLQTPTISYLYLVDGKSKPVDADQPFTVTIGDGKKHTLGVQVSHPLLLSEQGNKKGEYVYFEYCWWDEEYFADNGTTMTVNGLRSTEEPNLFSKAGTDRELHRVWVTDNTIPITEIDHARTDHNYYLVEIRGYIVKNGVPVRFYQSSNNFIHVGSGEDAATVNNCYTLQVNVDEVRIITATAGDNGAISPSGEVEVPKGESKTFTITPNDGYHIQDVKVDEKSVGAVKEYTFKDVTEPHTIHATFARNSSGGSHKPTVTIPDDVPTGLNGKDHYAYVVGYPDGMVYPQKNITRAEVATIFFRLLKDETREANMTKSNGYNDMKDGAWYTCAVSTLSKMGIIKGYEDGSFKPDASISRAEFAAIAARFDPDGDTTPATFSDVSSHWAKDEISIAANHGWIKGYEDGSFKPDQKITRAETMTLVNRVLKRLPETKDDLHKDMKTWPDNQNESAWFYLAVQEATNSHYQNLKKDGTHEKWESMRETRDWAALEK